MSTQRDLSKLAFGPTGARGPNSHASAPELVRQTFHQPVYGVLARDVDSGIAEPDEAQDRGNLKNLAGAPVLHVANGFLSEVDQGDDVDLDDLPDCFRVLSFELGI